MKKSCNNCKAFDEMNKICQLGYNIEITKRYQMFAIQWSPVENCPKPLTISKYVKLKENL